MTSSFELDLIVVFTVAYVLWLLWSYRHELGMWLRRHGTSDPACLARAGRARDALARCVAERYPSKVDR